MQSGDVTTPFGRRPVTYTMLAHQIGAEEVDADASVDKWKLFRALCEARMHFAVSDRALAVLNALLSFYPETVLKGEDRLVVFPSNAQLSLRAHGMAEQTIRRHIAALVDAGLLIRKDSANGKRFARRSRDGVIDEAFGFSLAPLLARADEIMVLAAEVEAERLALQRLKERLTICRRDVVKLIETALEEGAPGDWEGFYSRYRMIMAALPRNAGFAVAAACLEDITHLRENILKILEMQIKTQKPSGNANQNERHIQNSKPESFSDLEPRFEKTQGEIATNADKETEADGQTNEVQPPDAQTGMGEGRAAVNGGPPAGVTGVTGGGQGPGGLKPFPLGMVLSACPQIADYGPSGTIGAWRDMMAAGVVVRAMLGVSPSAYEEACEHLGPENAATVMACILERAHLINSPGGYLRDLTRRAQRGEFAIGPMIMALLRTNQTNKHKSA